MKSKLFLSFTLCISIYYGSSQSLSKLDQLAGFKKFKFGSSVSSYSNIKMQVIPNMPTQVSFYIYAGKDITSINGVPIDGISLFFFKNKLFQIRVDFGTIKTEYDKGQYELIQSNLETNFGTRFHSMAQSEQGEILNGSIWNAKSVRLESARVYFPSKDGKIDSRFNYTVGYLLFTNKKLETQQQASELK